MIKYVSGDILKTKADALAHGVAPNDNFKQGLAFTLREQWPAMFEDFKHYCRSRHPKEGTVWSWRGVGGPAIVSLFTQEHPKSHTSNPGKAKSSYVNHALRDLKKDIVENGFKSLAITRVATGVGGLDWEDVKPLIEKALGGLDIPVYVYEDFEKGKEAQEG